MLRLRNGNRLTEEPEAMNSFRLIQGVEYGYCSKLVFSVVGFLTVVTPVVLLLVMTVCLAAYLVHEDGSLGRHLPGYIYPRKVTDACDVNSGSTGVLHFAALPFSVVIQVLQQNPSAK